MAKRLQFQEMLDDLSQSLVAVPAHRTRRNTQYGIPDAGLGAFLVFYIQSSSFLAHQRVMQRQKGQNNAQGLFGLERIPSDTQIRNLLDPVEPAQLYELFWKIYTCLGEGGCLVKVQGVGSTRLISLDGSQYVSSQEMHCPNCRVSVRDEKTYYSHLMMAVVCAPEQEHVVYPEPEFITPQDGHKKQDGHGLPVDVRCPQCCLPTSAVPAQAIQHPGSQHSSSDYLGRFRYTKSREIDIMAEAPVENQRQMGRRAAGGLAAVSRARLGMPLPRNAASTGGPFRTKAGCFMTQVARSSLRLHVREEGRPVLVSS